VGEGDPQPVIDRLRKRADFVAAASGRKAHSALMTMQARRAAGNGAARIGLTVTRKVGTAVERNRIRRRLRTAVGAVAPLSAQPGHDYVIIARRSVLDVQYAALLAALAGAFRSVHAPKSGSGKGRLSKRVEDVG